VVLQYVVLAIGDNDVDDGLVTDVLLCRRLFCRGSLIQCYCFIVRPSRMNSLKLETI
jgi:hypothetical protein